MGHIQISTIDPARYYDVRFVATLRGLHAATVYQAAKGLKKAPIPQVTRFNTKLKFLGQHILDFIEDHGGTVAKASPSPDQDSKALASVSNAQAPRGRPRKVGRRSTTVGAAA